MNNRQHENAHNEADMAVTNRMFAIAEHLPIANIGEVIFECQTAAIDARLSGRLDLSALFVQIGAELIRTFNDGTVMMAATSRKSEAIRHLLSSEARGSHGPSTESCPDTVRRAPGQRPRRNRTSLG